MLTFFNLIRGLTRCCVARLQMRRFGRGRPPLLAAPDRRPSAGCPGSGSGSETWPYRLRQNAWPVSHPGDCRPQTWVRDVPPGVRGNAMQHHRVRTRSVVLVGLLAVLSFGAVDAPGAGQPGAPPRTGRYRGDITDPATGDVIMRVAMQVPENLPAEKHLGLLLLFHGSRGNENNYIGLTVASLRRLGLLDRYVVLS